MFYRLLSDCPSGNREFTTSLSLQLVLRKLDRTSATIVNIIDTIHVPHLSGLVFDGEPVDPPKKIPWYPGGLAYSMTASKRVIRKNPEFKKLHQFLVYETEVVRLSHHDQFMSS